MTRRIALLTLVLAGLLAGVALAAPVREVRVAKALAPIIVKVRRGPHAPILLPFRGPTIARFLYATGGHAGGRSTDFELASGRRCGDACLVGSFVALPGERLSHGAGIEQLRIRGGVRAAYLGLRCGASCSEPQIEFERGGVLYTFQWAVPRGKRARTTMIALANGALRAGPR